MARAKARDGRRRRRECFIDTGYFAAVVNHADQYHTRALEVGEELAASNARFVTTHAILLEIGNLLARAPLRPYALRVLDALAADDAVTVVSIDAALYARGLDLFRQRADKDWSLTDCLSFTVMAERRISDALAHDVHFEQAGFRALMRR